MAFELPKLPYAYTALEPHIDAKTMEIHHGKHHQAYVTNLNAALAGKEGENESIENICKNISKYPMPVRNNGGGHYNHSLFLTAIGYFEIFLQISSMLSFSASVSFIAVFKLVT